MILPLWPMPGYCSRPDSARILLSAVPAGIPFLAGLVGPVGTLSPSDSAKILFSTVPAGIPFPAGPVGTLTLPEYCLPPFLLG